MLYRSREIFLIQQIFIIYAYLSFETVEINARVKFTLGDLGEPFIIKTDNGNGSVLPNKDISLQMECRAQYPVEWVFDADDGPRHIQNRFRNEWTDRKFDSSIQGFQYIALLYFSTMKLIMDEEFKCKAVSDEGDDALIVRLQPQKNVDGETVLISTYFPRESRQRSRPGSCTYNFTVVDIPNVGFLIRCKESESGLTGKVVDYKCPYSAAYCANTRRHLKETERNCVERIPSGFGRLEDIGWTKVGARRGGPLIPGVAVCSLRDKERGALEYFFSAPDESGKRKIHFSWAEIEPNEMIWFEPPAVEEVYYIGQKFRTSCHVPKYGFSFDPIFGTVHNDVLVQRETDFEENQSERSWTKLFETELEMAGVYNLICMAPIWNTTEWANQTIEFRVQKSIPPTFEKPFENITLHDGEKYKEINCSAYGDPKPQVKWVVSTTLPGIKVTNETLTFLSVTDLVQGEYTCKADNSLGEISIKTLVVDVIKKNAGTGSASNVVPITIGISALAVMILVAGLLFFYYKFYKLKKLVAFLTAEEVKEFHEGRRNSDSDSIEKLDSMDFIASLPYNAEYELAQNKFQIDKISPLGSGAYGVVYKGTVTTDNGIIESAFKTVKPEADISYFKAILSELKILIYLGEHESIVKLIGAWTENIKEREVYLAVELCKFCLLSFIRDNARSFVNYVENGSISSQPIRTPGIYMNVSNQQTFSTFTLIQWAADIASALEYISSKRIIHGDVAARNILLTSTLQAKVCDFGLARQLIDYNYIKSEQCPLPWKWMAVESLKKMQFSTKSDVWAYGITLWEIFSLGNNPYPGLSWTHDFADQLENGLRMSSPSHSPNDAYEIMVECWHAVADCRPDFATIKRFFQSVRQPNSSIV